MAMRTCHLNEKYKELKLSFKQHCHDNSDTGGKAILGRIIVHVQNSVEVAFKKSKQSKINKLSLFQTKKNSEKEKDRDGIDLAGTRMKRWVKVLSKYKSTETEICGSSQGLELFNWHRRVFITEIVIVTELSCLSATSTRKWPNR